MCRPTFYTAAMPISFKFPGTVPNLSFCPFSPFINKYSLLFPLEPSLIFLYFLWYYEFFFCFFKSLQWSSHSNSLTPGKKMFLFTSVISRQKRKVRLQKSATVRFHLSLGAFLPKSVVSMSESILRLCSGSTAILAFQNCSEDWALLGEVRQYLRLSSPFTEQNDLCLHSPFLSLSFHGEEQ